MAHTVATTTIDWQCVRQELTAQRNNLFERLQRKPEEIRLAAEIRRLDDEICVCSDHLAQDYTKGLVEGTSKKHR